MQASVPFVSVSRIPAAPNTSFDGNRQRISGALDCSAFEREATLRFFVGGLFGVLIGARLFTERSLDL